MVKTKHVPASVRVRAVHLRAHEAMALVHEAALWTVPKEVTLIAPEFSEPLELTDGGSITERRHVRSRGPSRATVKPLQRTRISYFPN